MGLAMIILLVFYIGTKVRNNYELFIPHKTGILTLYIEWRKSGGRERYPAGRLPEKFLF
jgi:hypothetical protein